MDDPTDISLLFSCVSISSSYLFPCPIFVFPFFLVHRRVLPLIDRPIHLNVRLAPNVERVGTRKILTTVLYVARILALNVKTLPKKYSIDYIKFDCNLIASEDRVCSVK